MQASAPFLPPTISQLTLGINPVVRNPKVSTYTNVSDAVEEMPPPIKPIVNPAEAKPILKTVYTTY